MNDLLKYLPHILPTKCKLTADKHIIITSQYFKSLYGDLILKILRHTGALSESETYIKKAALNNTIQQIDALIALQHDGCFVWEQGGVLKIMPTNGIKDGGFSTYQKQQSAGNIDPNTFMIHTTQKPGFNDNCIVGMIFQSLMILFDHLLTQVRSIQWDKYFNQKVARLFNIIAATNQLNNFGNAFFYRLPRVKGAIKTANSKSNTRDIVKDIVLKLGIMSKDATSSITREHVKQEFKNQTGKGLKYSAKTLNDIIIDAAGHAHIS